MGQTVIPNLMRVGLVPERLVPGYLAQGFKIDLAERRVDDLHSWHVETRAMRSEFARESVDFSQAQEVSRFVSI
jgi:hypothetical protein